MEDFEKEEVVEEVQPEIAESKDLTEEEKLKACQTEAIFSIGSSPLFLIFAIVFSVNIVKDIIFSGFGSIFANVLPILMAVGMWITYADCLNKETKPSGMKLIKVPYMISYIFKFIVIGFMFIIPILLIVGGAALAPLAKEIAGQFTAEQLAEVGLTMEQVTKIAESFSTICLIVGIIALVVVVIVLVYNIFYYKSMKKALNAGVSALDSKAKPHLPVGNAPIVFLVIDGVVALITFISKAISLPLLTSFVGTVFPQLINSLPPEAIAELGINVGSITDSITKFIASLSSQVISTYLNGIFSVATIAIAIALLIQYNKKTTQK